MFHVRKLLVIILLQHVFLANLGFSQSTISLENLGIEDDSTEVESEMEACLLESMAADRSRRDRCISDEFYSETAITMGDIRNSLEFIGTTTVIESDADTSTALPSIDIEILFEYNSSNISSGQFNELVALSVILQNERYRNYRFVFVGHTDAKGGSVFNEALSLERAETVATFVASIAGFSTERVASIGMGYSRLKDPNNPLGGLNRRVQLVLVPNG